MSGSRRDFLKFSATAAVLAAAGGHLAASAAEAPPGAVGLLYDATLCIGCKSCMVNCKRVSSEPGGPLHRPGRGIPYEFREGDRVHDAPEDLSGRTVNIIKVYRQGTGMVKDRERDGYSFVKRQCMHCVEPACVSVCPVAALSKDPVTGVVGYAPDRCIGCRYCMLACPFGVPRFTWDTNDPRIVKCELCRHRYPDGGYAACCEFCPTGASLFGPVTELRREAEHRLTLSPGSEYAFPLGRIGSGRFSRNRVAGYHRHVYGLREAGGTQCLLLAGVPFALLGFNPGIGEEAYPQFTWNYIKKVPYLVGLLLVAGAAGRRLTAKDENDEEDI